MDLAGEHGAMAYCSAAVGSGGFATGGFDGRIVVRDWRGEIRKELAYPDGPFIFSLAAAPDGSRVLVAGGDAWWVMDPRSGDVLQRATQLGCGTHSHANWSPDARIVGCGGEGDLVRTWMSDGTPLGEYRTAYGQASDVSVLGDGTLLLATAAGAVVRLGHDGEERELHARHEDWIRCIDVSPDGRYAVSASQNCVVVLYDLLAGTCVDLPVLRQPLTAARFDAGGDLLLVDTLGGVTVEVGGARGA